MLPIYSLLNRLHILNILSKGTSIILHHETGPTSPGAPLYRDSKFPVAVSATGQCSGADFVGDKMIDTPSDGDNSDCDVNSN